MRLCLCIDAVMRGVLPAYMRVIHSLTVSLHSLPNFPPPFFTVSNNDNNILSTNSFTRILSFLFFFILIPLRDDSRDRNGSSKLEEIRSRGWSKGKLLP